MYSDPIAIICQEILSNCRDAHREVGKDDVPCIVKLPTKLDETIHFVDFGPGITPDRMENVFILYGNSTKRDGNEQTGGFGLGAKTPFSYTDSFSITTITEDEDGRHKREYIAYIDDSQIGAMSLVKTEEVDKSVSTGTTISVPVKQNDRRAFIANIKRTADYWDVRPIIKRGEVDWHNEKIAFQGTNWFITEGERYSYYNRGEPKAIIDGIQYRLNYSSIYNGSEPSNEERTLMQRGVRFKFKTGELDITANREDLDYQPGTIKVIQERVKEAIEELREKVNEAVKNSTSLWDAIIEWEKVSYSYSQLLVQPKWNGHKLFSSINPPSHPHDANIKMWVYNREDSNSFKISRRKWGKRIEIDPKWMLIEDDTGVSDTSRPHPDRIRTLFIQNQNISTVGVVGFLNQAGRQHYEDKYAFSHLDATKLSTIIKTRKPKVASTSSGGKTVARKIANLKKLESRRSQRGWSDYVHEWVPETGKTTQCDGIYVKIYCNECYLSDGTKITKDKIYKLAQALKIEVYGVLSRTVKKLGPKWVNLLDHVNAELAKLEKDTDIIAYLKVGDKGAIDKWLGDDYWAALLKIESKVGDKTKALGAWIEATKKSIAGREKFGQLVELQRYLSKPMTKLDGKKNDRLEGMKTAACVAYPLLKVIKDAYVYGGKDEIIEEFVSYVNMKDS